MCLRRINFEYLGSILRPNQQCLNAYDKLVDGMFKKMLANDQESRILVDLRDMLLPKLISGELRIPTAEKIVEEALA